jgi:hydrogenase maturation protease
MKRNVLIVGIGNFDRQDDGVAWHILQGIKEKLGRTTSASPYESTDEPEGDQDPRTLFSLQLFPEMLDTIAEFDHVCFVDAHTGAIEEELNFREVEPVQQANPLTHHMTPETLLSLTQIAHNKTPQSILVSVRGYSFQYQQQLSPETTRLAEKAIDRIWDWLNT